MRQETGRETELEEVLKLLGRGPWRGRAAGRGAQSLLLQAPDLTRSRYRPAVGSPVTKQAPCSGAQWKSEPGGLFPLENGNEDICESTVSGHGPYDPCRQVTRGSQVFWFVK